jgi:hypothetical protein
MTKRVLAGLLWSYLAWYGWSMYSGLQGWNPLWGPVIALTAVAVVAAIRVRREWAAREPSAPGLTGPAQSAEPA